MCFRFFFFFRTPAVSSVSGFLVGFVFFFLVTGLKKKKSSMGYKYLKYFVQTTNVLGRWMNVINQKRATTAIIIITPTSHHRPITNVHPSPPVRHFVCAYNCAQLSSDYVSVWPWRHLRKRKRNKRIDRRVFNISFFSGVWWAAQGRRASADREED